MASREEPVGAGYDRKCACPIDIDLVFIAELRVAAPPG